jgi:hypothetical protein
MKIGNEEVELVTDFASLREGMIVFLRGLDAIEGRYILLSREPYTYGTGHCFSVYPDRAIPPDKYVLSYRAVERRIVYRVVDPLLDARPVTRAKELAR